MADGDKNPSLKPEFAEKKQASRPRAQNLESEACSLAFLWSFRLGAWKFWPFGMAAAEFVCYARGRAA
jgi:hypothetical protein